MVTRRQGILGSIGLAFAPQSEAGVFAANTAAADDKTASVSKRAALKAIEATEGEIVHLLEPRRNGLFQWVESDLREAISRDHFEGLFIAPLRDPSGSSGAWVRQYAGPVQVNWFGAIADGKTDDARSIQAALDSGASQVVLPAGTYRIASPIRVDGNVSLIGQGANLKSAAIRPDTGVLEAIQFGMQRRFSGCVENILIDRASYSGSTQNIGFALYDVVNATFSACDSRHSKYPWRFKPGTGQRVAYTTFLNINATFGKHNISVDLSAGNGYANELVFVGGRCSTSRNTVSNVHIDQDCNHWRFYAMSLEGTGRQAAYVGGTSLGGAHTIVFDQCRTEGNWSSNDIVLEKATTLHCEVRAWNLYTTVSFDPGDNHLIQTASQNVVSVGSNQVSALELHRNGLASDTPILNLNDHYPSSGTSFGIRYSAKRGAGYLLQFLRGSKELVGWTLLGNSQALLSNLGRAVFRRRSQDRTEAVVTVRDEYASSGRSNLMEVRAGRDTGTAIGFTNDASNADQGGIEIVNNAVKFRSFGSGHTVAPLQLGEHYLWVDSSGSLRIKEGAPTSDKDGKRVGSEI
ncbi:MAG: glycosyl hydrolase family 28-related protein [Pseudomonadota bacterium]